MKIKSVKEALRLVVLAAAIAGSTLPSASEAQEPDCGEITAIARMAEAKSQEELARWRQRAGGSYRANLAYTIRFFELRPKDVAAASAVLDMMSKNDEQESVWHSYGHSLPSCRTESDDDLGVLGRFQLRFPGALARAVLMIPSRMTDYVSHANASSGYPDSDYAVQMQRVCRLRHHDFILAVKQLPPDTKKWLLSSTFDPEGCHAHHFPEQ